MHLTNLQDARAELGNPKVGPVRSGPVRSGPVRFEVGCDDGGGDGGDAVFWFFMRACVRARHRLIICPRPH